MEEVKIPITIEDAGFNAGAKRIITRMEDTQREVDKTGMSVEHFAREMQAYHQQMERLTAAVKENTASIQQDSHAAKQLGKELEETTEKGVQGFGRLEKAALGFFGLQQAKDFVGKVYDVRSEIESLETSFRILVGEKEKADALLSSIRKFAAETPMMLNDLAGAAQTMMGFGIEADEVMEDLEALGNASMGDSQRFQSLALAFSQTSATGKLMGQDLLQMINAGFNPLDQMAQTTGKSVAQLKEEMSEGAISAEMVRQAFIDATSEGGRLNGMLEAQSKTLAGSYSNLQGAIDDMLNEIGQKGEGVFGEAIEGATELVKNYEKVAEAVGGLVVAYGSYKAALMVCNAIDKASVSVKQAMAVQDALLTAEAKKLAAARGISVAAARAELGSVNLLTVAKMRLTAATESLTAAMMANPYVLVSMAVAGLCLGIYKLATAEDAETAARRRANEEMKTFEDNLDAQKSKIEGYLQTLQDSTATEYQKAEAWEMLNKIAPTLTEQYSKAELATMDLAEATRQLNEENEKASYEHLREEVEKWQETIEQVKQGMRDDARYGGGRNSLFYLKQLEEAEAQLDSYLKKLAEVDLIRKKLAEEQKPLEVRIREANGNAEAKAEIYSFYKKAADLAGELKEAHDAAAGTIANSSIPTDYNTIAEGARRKYDDLIGDLENDVEELRKKIAGSPASLGLVKELEGKEKVLDDLLQMKRQWELSGVTTIPLMFRWNFSQAESGMREAISGKGMNTAGMRWVQDFVSKAGGHWEKDEAHADTRTAAQWRQQAYGDWQKAQKAVDEFWQKKEGMDKATFQKEYERLKGVADQAKKDYDKLKGSKGNGDKRQKEKAVEQARRQEEYLQLLERQRVEQERAARDMELSTAQAGIDAMANGTKKTLAQITLDFEKQQERIERGYADLKQKKLDAAKRVWDADPGNKGKVFDAGSVDTSHTTAETENYKAQLAASVAEYVRAIAEMDIPDLPQSYIQDRIGEIKAAYEQEVKAIREEEAKLQESQGGLVSESQREDYVNRFSEAQAKMEEQVKALEAAEVERGKAKYKKLLQEFKSYEQKRTELEKKYQDDMAVYEAQRKNLGDGGDDMAELDASMAERTRQYKRDVQELQNDILTASDFYTKLFGEVSEKGYKSLRDFYRQSKETLEEAKVLADGVEIEIPVKDADGHFVKKAVKVTVDEFRKMKNQVQAIRSELEKDNPFAAFKGAWTDLKEAMKNDGDVAGALKQLNGQGHALTSTINSWGDSLGAVFGDRFAKSIDEAMQMVNGVMDMGTGIAQIYNGDIVGGITNVLNGLAGIVRLFTEWKEKMEEMRRQMYIAEIETSRELRKEREEYAGIRSTISDIIKGQEELNWLIEHGFAKAGSVSVWEAQQEELEAYMKSLEAETQAYDKLWAKVQGSRGHFEWGNSLNGGSSDWSLAGRSAEEIQLWYNQDKLTKEAREYYEAWVASGKSVEELVAHIEECRAGMREMVMGVNLDSFVGNVKSSLQEARGDVGRFADFAEETISQALMNAFMYQELAKLVEPLYNELSDALTEGTADDAFLAAWKKKYMDMMSDATSRLEELSAATGVDVFGSEDAAKEEKAYFDSLRDMWLSTLTDMEADGEAWKREIVRVMLEDLVGELVLGDGFESWLEDWKKAYKEALEAGDEVRMTALLEEQVAKREELAVQAQEIADALGYDEKALEEAERGFGDLRSALLDTLLDMDADAEAWGKKIRETLLREMVEKTIVERMGLGEKMEQLGERLLTLAGNDVLTEAERERGMAEVLAEMEASFGKASELVQKLRDSMGMNRDELEKDSPFKDLRKQFVDTLMDMDATAEDWAEDVGRTMSRKIVEQLMQAQLIEPLLERLDSAFEAAMSREGATWESVIPELAPYIEEMKEAFGDMQPMVEHVLNSFGLMKAAEEEAKDGFGNLRDTFVQSLMTMGGDAEQFAKSLQRTMTEQMVGKVIEQRFQSQLDALSEAWYDALEAGDTAAMGKIRQQLMELQAACGEAVKPLLDDLRVLEEEAVVDETVTSMRESWLNGLMEMKAGTQDFVSDIRKMLTQKLVEKTVLGGQFDAWLERMQGEYDSIMASGKGEREMAEQMKRLAAVWEEKAREMQEATQQIFELTGWSEMLERMSSPLSDLRSSFRSALTDMEKDTEAFGRDIQRVLTEAFVDRFVLGDEFEHRLAEWEEQYASIMRGNYSDEERAKLLKGLQDAISAAKAGYAEEAQAIQDLMGASVQSSDQTATMNMSEKATYDQFETYLGIAVAQQMATLQGNEVRLQILNTLQDMRGITSSNGGETVKEIRSLLNTTNEYLLDIKRSNRAMLEQFGSQIDNIISKLTRIV